jgi:hypothetical protein
MYSDYVKQSIVDQLCLPGRIFGKEIKFNTECGIWKVKRGRPKKKCIPTYVKQSIVFFTSRIKRANKKLTK